MKRFLIPSTTYAKSSLFIFGILLFSSCSNQDLADITSASNATSANIELSTLSSKKVISIKNVGSNNWMASLADDIDIREVSIPATHDSGTNGLMSLAKCQNLSISDQLKAGIRFLDIRVTPQGKGSISNFSLKLSHTFVSSIAFKDVLSDVKNFLLANPSETILIKIARDSGAEYDLPDNRKENIFLYNEYAPYKNNIKLENFVTQYLIAQEINKGYASLFTQTSSIKNKITMGSLRGRALLFYDYSKFPKSFQKINSISVGLYEDNVDKVQVLPATNPVLLVQDFYKNTWYTSKSADGSKKSGLITDFMTARHKLALQKVIDKYNGIKNTNNSPFSFNYISMSGVVTSPDDYAKNLNSYFLNTVVKNYIVPRTFAANTKSKLSYKVGFGITFFDFPSDELINAVYSDNF